MVPTICRLPIRLELLPDRDEPELVQTAERGQVGRGEGSVEHVEVFRMASVGTSILGGPRPLPGDRRAHPDYTVKCEEPVLSREIWVYVTGEMSGPLLRPSVPRELHSTFGGEMPIIAEDEQTLNARQCLQRTVVRAFSADPPNLDPTHTSTTLTWDVEVSPICRNLQILLDGSPVPARGTKIVEQFDRTTHVLRGRARAVEQVLGTLAVPFDLSSCQTFAIGGSVVSQILQWHLRQMVLAMEDMSLRSDPAIATVSGGISLAVRARRAIPAFADLNVDVDAVIALSVVEGRPEAFFRSFDVDTDFPWWVTGLTAGVSKIVEEVADGFAERRVRRAVRAALASLFEQLSEQLPDLRLHALSLTEQELLVTLCRIDEDGTEVPTTHGEPGELAPR